MSKYRERANEILKEHVSIDVNGECTEGKGVFIDLMCLLAEEVESNLYTKEQVEKLLQKQRELCVEECDIIDNGYTDELPDGNLYYFEKWTIDKSSILNAKLNINEL